MDHNSGCNHTYRNKGHKHDGARKEISAGLIIGIAFHLNSSSIVVTPIHASTSLSIS
jgi:hypothetical protein